MLSELLDKMKAEAVAAVNQGDDDYNKGKRLAYYDLLTFLLDHGAVFNITAADLGLDHFDATELLAQKAE